MLGALRGLAERIKDEATKIVFDMQAVKALMKELTESLTSKKNIMCYEFKESGLLEALNLYLTYTPN